ncbi:hypothetical protein PInf_011084 [Phytophthora infestans]|nr:hypothetical protein PInf_011084 [Phytophthora infestans]
MAFQARWRELRREELSSKRPQGVSVDFTYIMPGQSTKGVRGKYFFVGEKDLMAFLDQLDLAIPLAQRTLEYDLFGDDDSSEEDVVESDEEVVNVVNEGGDEIEPPPEVVTNEPDAVQPLAIVDDPNLVQPGERPENFAGLDSDAKTEDGFVYYDDDDLGSEEPDPAEVEDTEPPVDMHFDESLLEAVGGSDLISGQQQ